MKKLFNRKKVSQWWKNLMKSSQNRMSRGSQSISKIISWARGENWRGRKEKKK